VKVTNRAMLLAMLLGFALVSTDAPAQKTTASEIEAVKAANSAFYAALSARDTAAIKNIWSSEANVQNAGPRSKNFDVGWEAQKRGYDAVFNAFPVLKVTMDEPRIRINGNTAWVSGIENAERKNKAGETINGTNLGTSIFVKRGGRWLMVYHHASAVPQ
jgi:ketosteroid isomerase-like protein